MQNQICSNNTSCIIDDINQYSNRENDSHTCNVVNAKDICSKQSIKKNCNDAKIGNSSNATAKDENPDIIGSVSNNNNSYIYNNENNDGSKSSNNQNSSNTSEENDGMGNIGALAGIGNNSKLQPSFYNYFFTKNQNLRDNPNEFSTQYHRQAISSNNSNYFVDRNNNAIVSLPFNYVQSLDSEGLSKSLEEMNSHAVNCVRGVRTITRNPSRGTRKKAIGVATKYRTSQGRHPEFSVAKEKDRARMFNEAFDCLRKRIPSIPASKKLSKIEILRLAICYMSYLKFLLEGDVKQSNSSNSDVSPEREAKAILSLSPTVSDVKDKSSEVTLLDESMASLTE